MIITISIILLVQKNKPRGLILIVENKILGTGLLSLMEVPSALKCLTALFGMGRGVTTSLEAPETINSKLIGVGMKDGKRCYHFARSTENFGFHIINMGFLPI